MNDESIVHMSDPRIRAIKSHECGEPFVNLLDGQQGLLVDGSRKDIGNLTLYFASVRRKVALLLLEAQRNLPGGKRILVKEGFRPRSLQQMFYTEYEAKLSVAHPDWIASQLEAAVSEYVAPPDVAPHSTGGAVDLTLVDADQHEMDMGTRFNAHPDIASYTASTQISQAARDNRNLLITAMRRAGFVNYPTEWWHWSFGDRYWAFCTGEKEAIYDAIEVPDYRSEN